MTSPIPPAIQINDLHYAYPPRIQGEAPVEILRGVNLQVDRGEFVALLGRVGAGKTTLCMTLNGLVPHATGGIFRGDVTVLGRNTKRHAIADLAQAAGLVFQDPETQLTQMRVEDEVAFGLENLGVPSEEIEERVMWALDAVGLAAYRDRSPLLLSGGEKQRVAIAAMLAMRPQVLVLDEPTANLDPAGKGSVFNLLARLAHERQITILLATQEIERVARYAGRVLILHDGRIGMDGAPAEIFSQAPRLREWGVGVPQLAELSDDLSRQTGRSYHFIRLGQAFAQLRAERSAGFANSRQVAPDELPTSNLQPPTSNLQRPTSNLQLDNVSFTYPDGTPALRDVSLTIGAGEFVALLGPNGSGKTTLAKHLNGLLKPARGRVLVAGRDTRPLRVAELARLVGYVFQNPDHQIFAATVEDEVAFGLRLRELPPAEVRQRVEAALAPFELAPWRDLPPALLGWGQRRQVALAAVLATQPQVLILDEPTGGLDSRSREDLMAVVAAYNRTGRTVLLITHDMRLAAEHAGRAVVMLDGRIAFDGRPAALFERRDVLAQAKLAVPPVVRLSQRLAPYGLTPGMLTCADFVTAWQALLRRTGATTPGTESRQAEDADGR